MQRHELTERLDDPDALESHLQSEYVDSVIEQADSHSCVSLKCYGPHDLDLTDETIRTASFTLDSYRLTKTGLGTIKINIRASTRELLPTTNCEYGPGGHDIELAATPLVYKATIRSDVAALHVDATVFAGHPCDNS